MKPITPYDTARFIADILRERDALFVDLRKVQAENAILRKKLKQNPPQEALVKRQQKVNNDA